MTALTLADAFAKSAFANRIPFWWEYAGGSPCDQRAILARWQEIVDLFSQGQAHVCDAKIACCLLIYAGQPVPLKTEIEKAMRTRTHELRRSPMLDIEDWSGANHTEYGDAAKSSHEKFNDEMRKDAAEENENQFLGGGFT